jgi:hypothetical protein
MCLSITEAMVFFKNAKQAFWKKNAFKHNMAFLTNTSVTYSSNGFLKNAKQAFFKNAFTNITH